MPRRSHLFDDNRERHHQNEPGIDAGGDGEKTAEVEAPQHPGQGCHADQRAQPRQPPAKSTSRRLDARARHWRVSMR